jgi:RimJ/RimL family protein N-acetyltransferase
MPAPRIETERLILRPHGVTDFTAMAAMWADPIVVRHIGKQPSSGEQTWARLLRYAGHWALLEYGFWAIEDKANGKLAGEVGVADFKREVDPPIEDPETGWVLAPWAHGKGYATEALRAVLAWADARFPATQCVIDLDNAASRNVAAKCGYSEIARTTYHGDALIILRRHRQSPAQT